MNNKKIHIVETVSKSNNKIIERGNIDTLYTHIYLDYSSFSWR
jgi:hypothetical protein